MHFKSQHKVIQTVKDSKVNDLSFNMYSVLKFRLQNSMTVIYLSALEVIIFFIKIPYEVWHDVLEKISIIYAPLKTSLKKPFCPVSKAP